MLVTTIGFSSPKLENVMAWVERKLVDKGFYHRAHTFENKNRYVLYFNDSTFHDHEVIVIVERKNERSQWKAVI